MSTEHYRAGQRAYNNGWRPQQTSEFWSADAAAGYYDAKLQEERAKPKNKQINLMAKYGLKLYNHSQMLAEVRDVLRGYARSHYAKGTAEGAKKGLVNDALADKISAVLDE